MAASARTKRSSSWGAVEGWNSGSLGRAVSVSLQAFHSTTSPIFLFEIIGMKDHQLPKWQKKPGNSTHESQKAGWDDQIRWSKIWLIPSNQPWSWLTQLYKWSELGRKDFVGNHFFVLDRVSRQQGPWFHMERCYYLSQDPREITLKQTTTSLLQLLSVQNYRCVFVSENPPTAQFIATAFP